MTISLIIAIAENNVIGKDNALIWRLSDDLKSFKKLTTGHCILMGRKTYDSIGRPLPNRQHIIISRNPDLHIEGCHVVHSLKEGIELGKEIELKNEIFIIGGSEIYKQSLPFVQKVYLTKVKGKPEGDAFFDKAVFENWQIMESQSYKKNDKNEFDFDILTLIKAIE